LVNKFWGLFLVFIILLVVRFVPEQSVVCFYRELTNIPDGGCGTLRSLKSLAVLDILSSFNYNPLVPFILLFIAAFPFISEKMRMPFITFILLSFFILTVLRFYLHIKGIRIPVIYPPNL